MQHYRRNKLKLRTNFIERTYKDTYDRIRGYMIRNSKSRARQLGLEFDITFEDFELPKYCPLLNIPLKFRGDEGMNENNRASLDRIDNTKGYVKGNVWVVSMLANSMKNQATLDQLELFCKNALQLIENHRTRGGITDSVSLDP